MSELYNFKIRSSIQGYSVNVGAGFCETHFAQSNRFFIIDENLLKWYSWLSLENSVLIKAEENLKSLNTVASVIESLRDQGANRHSKIAVCGGGIIQDVGTLVSALYMRGLSWDLYPTTLLSMADSCIGGKSSINVGKYKNIAGNFYPPQNVFIDAEFSRSLSNQQLIEGIFEAVKICFASEYQEFPRILDLLKTDYRNPLAVQEIVKLSLLTKKRFIEEDEFDQNIRLLLNFGHTFGHAIEAASQFAIGHGIAVGIGMLLALECYSLYTSTKKLANRAQDLQSLSISLLSSIKGLADTIANLDESELFGKFLSDKKHSNEKYYVILPNSEGFIERVGIDKDRHGEESIKETFKKLKDIAEKIR